MSCRPSAGRRQASAQSLDQRAHLTHAEAGATRRVQRIVLDRVGADGEPLGDGATAAAPSVTALAVVLLAVVGWAGFRRRDIGEGARCQPAC